MKAVKKRQPYNLILLVREKFSFNLVEFSIIARAMLVF